MQGLIGRLLLQFPKHPCSRDLFHPIPDRAAICRRLPEPMAGRSGVVGNNDLDDVLQPVERNVVEGLVLKSTYTSERIGGLV